MAKETATIRVARATRDLLAEHAHARGVSLAALLAEVARERELESIWRAERQAGRIDAENPDVAVEDRAWETTLADGIEADGIE
jgi:antitoxin MazE7